MNDTHPRPLIRLPRRDALKWAGGGMLAAWTGHWAGNRAAAAEPVKQSSTTSIAPLLTEFVYEAQVTIATTVEVGRSSRGTRRYIPITGGTFLGPQLRGTVLPGGADWQLDRPDGASEVDALYSMKCDDGAVIVVRNHGLIAAGGSYLRTTPQFEAPLGPHEWLNKAIFVGSVSGAPQPGAVIIRVFKVL